MAELRTMDGLGAERCIEVMPSGRGCSFLEVEGMEYCLHHMPDDRLEEAEQITGVKRCHQHPDGYYRCLEYATDGTDHCASHSQRAKGTKVKIQFAREALDRAAEIISTYGERLANPDPVADPFAELMAVAGELREWKNTLRAMVTNLEGKLRFNGGDSGEQTRAEVILYTQAIRDLSVVLRDIAKLNIDERMVAIHKQTADMMQRALDAALERAGVGLDKQAEARETFRSHLTLVQGTGEQVA
jgi:hypothetical protein